MKIKEIREEMVIFDDGSRLFSDHLQDCCEWHYLDFNMLKDYNISPKTGKPIDIYQQEFDFLNGVPFKRVKGMGIILYDKDENGYLINGYGYNNGYYGGNIDLVYEDKNKKVLYKYNVTECQKVEEN